MREDLSITRLTILKNLCKDPVAASHFAVHLIQLAEKRMKTTQKSTYRPLVNKAVKALAAELKRPSPNKQALFSLHSQLVAVQNQHRPLKWGSVRIIDSQETLLAEYAVNCLLRPEESAYWGYQIAAHYSERYNSRFPWSLTPASAPLVEDIAQFWRNWQAEQ